MNHIENQRLNRCGWCSKPMADGQRVYLIDAGEWDDQEHSIGADVSGGYVCSKRCVREAVTAWWPGRG